jgi:phosphomannomutase
MSDTLGSRLTYQPRELKFGTSGRRGAVVDLTQLEIYTNARAEVEYLQSLPVKEGGIVPGDEFYFAFDLRPSSTVFVDEFGGRGEIAQAVACAIRDAGMRPVNLGRLPTPALTYYALARAKGSIMVTGSHIPFDRNGYKLNTSQGELLKHHEEPIQRKVDALRRSLGEKTFAESPFNEQGFLKAGHCELPAARADAESFYLDRYATFFEGLSLAGRRFVVYQHSAVGRDLLVKLLEKFGAEVIPMGRSDTFVPIDTENIDAEQLGVIQSLADEAARLHGPINAVVSTDGDSDRPLILGVDRAGKVRFFPGDVVGMVVAEYLGADAIVVPISCNDALDRGPLAAVLEPKTRIGSPYVIAGMEQARAKGRRRVCGWEANGGFLLGSDIERNGRVLTRLATRDAFLPISCVLFAAEQKGISLGDLFARLPQRFSRAALLRNFPRATSLRILERLRERPEEFFPPGGEFGPIAAIDTTDGVRIRFSNDEIVHVRPSGNADELRIYAVAGTEQRADEIAAMGIAEPGGLLRRMEKAVAAGQAL